MKKQMKKSTPLLVLSMIMALSVLFGVMLWPTQAAETTPEWVADYTVTASCGSGNGVVGYFNGSSACIDPNTGDLHYCTANFPYSEMQCAVYKIFMNSTENSPENVNAAINGNVFINLDTALAVTAIDVHTHLRSKDDTPTVQGVQYFTELTYFVFDGDGLYDGRYDGDDTLKSIDLSKNTKITELRLEYVSMESVDLSANTEIAKLVLIHASSSVSSREDGFKGLTRFKSLDLSKQTKLTDLTIYDEDIEALDLSHNTALTRLDLRLLQKLKTIDISENEALNYLYVSRSGLAEFDLGSKPNLTQADIIINADLKSVNLTGCTALSDLVLEANALENVDFSKNTALKSLNVNQNQFKTLDLSKNTELTSLSCQGNLLTCLDLSKNTKLSTVSTGTQYCTVGSVTDDILDLNVFPNFDISKVQKKSDGSGGTYQFNVKSSNSFSATNNYKNVGEDLLLNVDGQNCYVYYSYLVGTKSNGTEIYMSVELEIENKYYTVKCETLGVALKAFNYSTGVGADITTAKRGNSLQFVVEVNEDSPLYGKKLAVFSQASGGEKVAASEYEYNGTVYYSVSSINAPTSIIVEEGHECVFSDWAPVENNTSEHERHCTVTGCTESETGYCSSFYGAEYHADKDTMQKDCTRCGRQYTWNIDVSESVHVPAADAQCDAPGNTEFWICGHCDKYFSDENCQHEVTPGQVYISPLEHNYVNNICSECGDEITSARFEQSPEDVFASDDGYLYVLIGKGSNGKLYAMGEATADGRRYGVEIPGAQIDENGVVTLNSDQAEFMNFEYYYEDGATATTLCTFLVDGNYMTARNGRIYTFPESRLDDHGNPRPFDFRQADYGDESGLGYIFCDLYDPSDYSHFNEYITFNPDTCCFEACDTQQNTIYLYRQICEHESIHLSHIYPVAPTCTEQGYGGDYWFCSMCQTYFTDESCAAELEIPEHESINEYFLLPALEHSFASNGVCENCGMRRNVYRPVTTLEQFDQLSENAYYIIVFKDGGKTYAAYVPNLNMFRKMVTADADGDGLIDLLETDVNANGVPDIIEEYVDTQWGGADADEDGTTTADEYKEAIGSLDEDEDVDAEDYKAFFSWHIEYDLNEKFCEEYEVNHANVVEVTVADDGSITIIDEAAMEFQMMPSGIWGGQSDFDGIDPEYEIADSERLRAFWIPNYWIANDGLMGEYGENHHFMMQYRWFGDGFAPGITDNHNWKISFNEDGTAVLVSTWTTFDNSAALQLVKYTDEFGNECVSMIGCYGERWQYSDFLSNCTVISGAYLYASEPVYDESFHTCRFGAWYEIDGGLHRRDCECGEFEVATHTFGEWGEYAGFEGITRHCTADGCDAYETKPETPPHNCIFDQWEEKDESTHERACTICGETEEAPHSFSEWKPDPNDTMKHYRECVCGRYEDGDHTYGEWTMKDENYHTHSCPTCGATEDFEHSFYDWIAKDNNDHVHECMECDYESVLPHDYVREVTKEPTEREVGEATYTCTLCSHSYTEELPKKIAQISGDVVGTVLNVPNGSNAYIPEGTVFDVVENPTTEVPEQVLGEIAVTADGAAKPLGMYDLSLLLDGAKIQPDGTVEVTLPAPDLAAEYDKIIVVYIAPDGSYEECKTTLNEDGTITFETDHFSFYAVIGITEDAGSDTEPGTEPGTTPGTDAPSTPDDPDTPNDPDKKDGLGTGAIIGIVLGAVAIVGVGGFCLYWFVIRKKKLTA